MNTIDRFSGQYRWLSNFQPACIVLDGVNYGSVEHAYQASKTVVPEEREAILRTTHANAKRLGRRVTLRPDWEQVKEHLMLGFLRQKFHRPFMDEYLLATGDAELVEGNYWHDNYWGSCTCPRCGNNGKNRLGMLLMQVRSELAFESLSQPGA